MQKLRIHDSAAFRTALRKNSTNAILIHKKQKKEADLDSAHELTTKKKTPIPTSILITFL